MNDKMMLWLLVGLVGVNLYISYQVAMGLQDAADKIKNPLKALGL